MENPHQTIMNATLAPLAEVLCQPDQWPRFLPHVPHAAYNQDDTLAITAACRGIRLRTTAQITPAISESTCVLTLLHGHGLLRGLREEWRAAERNGHLVVSAAATWNARPWPLRRLLAERLYISCVIPATANQLRILAESDWRSRAASARVLD